MSCFGCEAKVKKDLTKVENVTVVKVSKEKKEAIIEMSKHIKLNVLQEALGGKDSKYQISESNNDLKEEVTQKSCCSTDNKEPSNNQTNTQFTCPIHAEIIQD